MPTIHRSATIHATPDAIWNYLAEPSNWPGWDPDMVSVDADGTGFSEGQTWTVRLKQPITATLTFSGIEPQRRFDWAVRAWGGLIRSSATFRLDPAEDGTTAFHYDFEMGGLIGATIQRLQGSTVARGVDDGLANIAAATAGGS